MNTLNQTIAKLIILPLFGGALITGVAVGTADSAAATTEVTAWNPPPPAKQSPSEAAIWDGEMTPAAPAAPARPEVTLNGIRLDADAPAPAAPAPATKPAAPGQQESGTLDKKDGAKSGKGNSARQ